MSDTLPNTRDAKVRLTEYFTARQTLADLAAAAQPANKAVLFDVLAKAGITAVVVEFDGAGDAGQIESLAAYADERVVALPDAAIAFREPGPDATGLTDRTCPLAEAVETLAYDLLEQEHDGWEINDGAFGTFDVADRSIQLAMNARFTDTFLTEQTY